MEKITDPSKEEQSTGYLIVRVSTARGAVPLEGATVTIRGGEQEDSAILYSLVSDRDGLCPRVSLPTPPLKNSEAPNSGIPYSLWNIDVFLEEYAPASYQNVPVYSGVTSVQPAVLIPLPEGYTEVERYNESQTPNL